MTYSSIDARFEFTVKKNDFFPRSGHFRVRVVSPRQDRVFEISTKILGALQLSFDQIRAVKQTVMCASALVTTGAKNLSSIVLQ